LAGAFFAVVFFAGAFLAVVFFLAGDFFAVVFFLAGAFLAVVFLAGDFLAAAFLAVGFLMVFLGPPSLVLDRAAASARVTLPSLFRSAGSLVGFVPAACASDRVTFPSLLESPLRLNMSLFCARGENEQHTKV